MLTVGPDRPASRSSPSVSPSTYTTRWPAARPGQGAGLVEQHGVHGPHPLQGQAVLDQDAVAGRQRGRDGDDQGDVPAEGVGAGDHQHRHGAFDGLVGLAQGQPDHHRDESSADGEVEQQPGARSANAWARDPDGLGLLDQPADAGQGGLLPDRGDADPMVESVATVPATTRSPGPWAPGGTRR